MLITATHFFVFVVPNQSQTMSIVGHRPSGDRLTHAL